MSSSLEAKIVVLGSQDVTKFLYPPSSGVGKTSLVHRYVHNTFTPPTTPSTIGASFLTKRVFDSTSDTVVRLQIWDTAGQERFRSISRLYYRGANAAVLCYDITDEDSFEEMGRWMMELKKYLGDEVVVHVVGTKSDIVDCGERERRVPFERCISYVAEHFNPAMATSPVVGSVGTSSKRSSGIWGQDVGWDCCHEISAREGEGVEEVFRVITRKLVEQRNKKLEREMAALERGASRTPRFEGGGGGYFDGVGDGNGSFRVGHGDKRRSWLGFPQGVGDEDEGDTEVEGVVRRKKGKCC
ncbi:MAG: hypothetical protein M1812_002523 [Candelaria pacifica]|nr:MAG: hypothetical protein M1812_002523 [Candelaria pacifica]